MNLVLAVITIIFIHHYFTVTLKKSKFKIMLHNINKLGTVLNKEAQKDINGGYGLCAGGPMYAFCPPDSANSQDPCTICVNLF